MEWLAWTLGVVVAVLFALAVYFVFVRELLERRILAKVVAAGDDAIGWIVQASSGGIFDDIPAQVILQYANRFDLAPILARLLARLVELKQGAAPSRAEFQLAAEVLNERFRPTHRFRIPPELIDGVELYLADVLIRRELLPRLVIDPNRPYVHCKAVPGPSGRVAMVPYPPDDSPDADTKPENN